ncbi:Phosphoenolpyruvate guanylyltransferase [Cupriavidus yeoncheonensis]|uniref:3-phospho-D-glycerate guanylyltransferase n=1 Tax=Cupriavidus yeoncheonensis TaxID=1462994 RepID=A0A916J0H3_9BURK|nr:2-phospho-L-lactate guanylyltransferase [Cupriavidus yeoncheonensis]CAG2157665.1 Phosphoenolpyruvate guanylyltransferase [Cupriavidus yeoncheonensis]
MNASGLWAVVPVKRFGNAKQRLDPVLSPGERASLACCMYADVLQALADSPCLAGILVVTDDPLAADLARRAGAGVLRDASPGLVPALEHAACRLASAGAAGMLVVPADVPWITPADIEIIALAHRHRPAVTLVAASDDGGTNALACSPPGAIPLSYGTDSFARHRQAALDAGLTPKVLNLPRFGRDIDRPSDLLAFLARPSATQTHAWLLASGVSRRLLESQTPAPLPEPADALSLLPKD